MLTSWPSYAQNIFVFVFFWGRRCAANLFFVCLFFVVRVREGGGGREPKKNKNGRGANCCANFLGVRVMFFFGSCAVFFPLRVCVFLHS